MYSLERVLELYWGYDSFLPLQKEAMECVINGQDSIVILPTGGGKSLCFQAPAMCLHGMAVIVSPLISLMKDQVDSLTEIGIPAAFINSSLSSDERRSVIQEIQQGNIKILYVAPERLMLRDFLEILKKIELSFISVDEAHCISIWGHDFRPEYRKLRILKNVFPDINLHAYTATATEHVRDDICNELGLNNHKILVGSFDRKNLIYNISHRDKILDQVCSVIEDHKSESGIIYCIRRSDVDDLCSKLNQKGYKALPYHAGMTDEDRKRNQESFINDKVDIIVATVAFGMGIDKSNIRYVIHSGMPKSLEHYQQETGRAGRDGLEAECCLFYSYSDFMTWQSILGDSNSEVNGIALKKLKDIYEFCISHVCRHQAIVSYFGQGYNKDSCEACDVCINKQEPLEDSLIIAQKIISCVLRLKIPYGITYIVRVLIGSKDKRIIKAGHNKLSTWGILAENSRKNVRGWIEQLISQGYLKQEEEYSTILVTEKGWRVIRENETPKLFKQQEEPMEKSRIYVDSWEDVDENLFSVLRSLRRKLADEQEVPAFIIFGDVSLRDMARQKPSNLKEFLNVKGVGQKKCEAYGEIFTKVIAGFCNGNLSELKSNTTFTKNKYSEPNSNGKKDQAFEMFEQNYPLEQIAQSLGRSYSTVIGYLEDYIKDKKVSLPSQWVDDKIYLRVIEAVGKVGIDRLKPIFDFFDGEISYDQIRISVACLKNISSLRSENEKIKSMIPT